MIFVVQFFYKCFKIRHLVLKITHKASTRRQLRSAFTRLWSEKVFFFFFLLQFVSSMSLLFSFCNVLFIQIFVFFTACNKRELCLKTVVTHPKKKTHVLR